MKIYASRNSDILDRLVGTNVWIKIRGIYSLNSSEKYLWINIQDIDQDGKYVFNYIGDSIVINDGGTNLHDTWDIQNILNRPPVRYDKVLVRFVSPITTLTTNELFDVMSDEDLINNLKANEWISAYIVGDSQEGLLFINIVSDLGDSYILHKITYRVFFHREYSYTIEDLNQMLHEEFEVKKENIDIKHPYEIYTTQDFIDEVNNNENTLQ